MAKRRGPTLITRKHLARAEREKRLSRYIMLGTGLVLLFVVGLISFGTIDERVIQPRQAVATVNGETITTAEFQTRVRYQRRQLVQQYLNIATTLQQLGPDPNIASIFGNNLSQIELQLDNTAFLGQNSLDGLVEDALIRQEASKMGISISDEEIDVAIQEAFGYFPDGTPTPEPTAEPQATSTLTALQRSLVTSTPTLEVEPTEEPTAAPAATPAEDPEATPTEPPEPTATATPYTLEEFQANLQAALDNLSSEISFSEADLRQLFETQLLREKIFEQITADLPAEQEQVWARHILVENEEIARLVLARLEDGDDWTDLAAEFSTDESNKDRGGDLGWFGRGQMVGEFEAAAYSLEVGETSEPVQTSFGWHIIQALGHETRPLSPSAYEQAQFEEFQNWLDDLRDSSEVTILDVWTTRVPDDPSVPVNVRAAVQQILAQSAQPVPELTPQGPAEEPPADQ